MELGVENCRYLKPGEQNFEVVWIVATRIAGEEEAGEEEAGEEEAGEEEAGT